MGAVVIGVFAVEITSETDFPIHFVSIDSSSRTAYASIRYNVAPHIQRSLLVLLSAPVGRGLCLVVLAIWGSVVAPQPVSNIDFPNQTNGGYTRR